MNEPEVIVVRETMAETIARMKQRPGQVIDKPDVELRERLKAMHPEVEARNESPATPKRAGRVKAKRMRGAGFRTAKDWLYLYRKARSGPKRFQHVFHLKTGGCGRGKGYELAPKWVFELFIDETDHEAMCDYCLRRFSVK